MPNYPYWLTSGYQTYFPRVQTPILKDDNGNQAFLFSGGTLTHDLSPEADKTVRTMDGTMRPFNLYGGWRPRIFTWTFDKSPRGYVDDLWNWYLKCRGERSVAPQQIYLKAQYAERSAADNETWIPVVMTSIKVVRHMTPMQRAIYFSGTAVFEEAYDANALNKGTLMSGGDPETEVI